MDDSDFLAARFTEHRDHLRAVAYRLLGSAAEADDAVQEAWLRLSRSDPDEIDNLGGWLTTVVARVALSMLRSRAGRREEPLDDRLPEPAGDGDPVGMALLVVLDTLPPAERLSFVLHDLFGMPFEQIAPVVGRTPVAARQLASRARRRVAGATPRSTADLARRREVVDAFLAASRGGDFDRLLELLDPGVVLRADGTAVRAGAEREVRGARAVAATFSGRARAVRPVLVDGVPGAVWSQGGRTRMVFRFTVVAGRVTAIEMVADPGRIAALELSRPGD
jgi:RNA polymerase sigma factor (sigma-70 family)